jgi:uncharacterized DUF497 family protein
MNQYVACKKCSASVPVLRGVIRDKHIDTSYTLSVLWPREITVEHIVAKCFHLRMGLVCIDKSPSHLSKIADLAYDPTTDQIGVVCALLWHTGDGPTITDAECEEIFFNDPLVAGADPKQSKRERRYYALGQTDAGRPLFIAFTIRKNLIRVISGRDMTKKELRKYSQ